MSSENVVKLQKYAKKLKDDGGDYILEHWSEETYVDLLARTAGDVEKAKREIKRLASTWAARPQ